ncbi:class I SAM-dependent methyltransferase [Candidatus Dependentiae bacterium]
MLFSKKIFIFLFLSCVSIANLPDLDTQESQDLLDCVVSKRTSENFIINPEKVHFIEKAWSVNTGGPSCKNYYAITINGKFYKGNRLWDTRWNIIKDATDYDGKNILELGCNMGLIATCLKKYRNANVSVGVEGPDSFLARQGSPHRVRAAKWFAQGFEVDVKFVQADLSGEPNYESKIGYDYDIVFCFSLMHWIKDKKRLLAYLSQFNEVIYEGHDGLTTELNRFKQCGFNHYRILGRAKRGEIIHFTK